MAQLLWDGGSIISHFVISNTTGSAPAASQQCHKDVHSCHSQTLNSFCSSIWIVTAAPLKTTNLSSIQYRSKLACGTQ